MLRMLSWSSGLGCDKVSGSEYSTLVTTEQTSPTTPSLPMSPSVKRKRSSSFDAAVDNVIAPLSTSVCANQGSLGLSQADANCIKIEHATPVDQPKSDHLVQADNLKASPQDNHSAVMTSQARLAMMRQTISSQLSLEILLKHKELRLIDQEMAKCQVALEQLRRCTEIPFPCTQTPSDAVSQGSGPAIRRLGQRYPPDSPAPWGVADGPYSRHYAKWLLEDRRFDGGEPEPELVQPLSAVSASGRSTRGHYVDVLGGKSVKPRARHSSNLQALPAGYGQPKEKATGPMILKRKSDNTMVKLVCPDCGRHDFGSAQGFINHCRIGHSRSFASHDAAAEACGEPVEYNDNGSIKGMEAVVTCSTTNTSVHPLVRSAKLLPQSSPSAPSPYSDYVPGAKKSAKQPIKPVSPDFQPSVQTPHLSVLIKNQGLGLDLQHLVTDAKTKVEMPESDASEDDMDIDSPVPTRGGRHPLVAGSKQPVKSSMSHAHPTLLQSSLRTGSDTQATFSTSPQNVAEVGSQDSFSGVLPSPTNESTQAPSLVDDDEEFDPQSPMSSGEMDEADVDFEVHDDDHHSERAATFQALSAQQPTCSPNPTATSTGSKTRRGIQSSDKHVTFVSPSPMPEGSDRKRRKI